MNDGMGAMVASLAAIVLAGGLAAVLAWWIVAALGIAGLGGALLTVLIAMFLALLLFGVEAVVIKMLLGRRS